MLLHGAAWNGIGVLIANVDDSIADLDGNLLLDV